MSVRFIDSFDHYNDLTEMGRKWTTVAAGALSAGNGRNGTQSYRATGWSLGDAAITLDAQATWYVGFALKMSAFTSGTPAPIVRFYSDATLQDDFRIGPGGLVQCYRNGTAIGVVSTTALALNTWQYVEFRLTIGDSPDGIAQMRVNGVLDATLNSTGLDTRNGTPSTANIIMLLGGSTAVTANIDIDDFYAVDTAGTWPRNTFLGDVRVDALYPNATGNYAQWTSNTGDANYLNVDDTAPDDDTSYNSNVTATNKDTFNFTNLSSSTGTIYAVQHNLYARKDDAGSRVIAPMARISSADYVSATTHSIGDTYAYWRQVVENDPSITSNWTVSQVNAAEFGYRLES